MLFANGQTWAHIVAEACQATEKDMAGFLSSEETLALSGKGDPRQVTQ